MKSEWQSWIQIIVILLSWFAVSSGLGFILRKHFSPLLPLRTARPPKHYYLLVKSIPQMHLPDFNPYEEHQDYRDYLIHGENSEPMPFAVKPVLEEAAAFFDEEDIVDHYTITHHITRVRRKGQIYSKYLRHPLGFRSKRVPTRGMFGLDNHDFVLTALSQGDIKSDFTKTRSRTGRRGRHRVREPQPNVPLPGRMSVGQGSPNHKQPDTKFLNQRIIELRQRERMLETRERMLEMLNAGKRKR